MEKREQPPEAGVLSRILSIFAEVHPDEALSVVLLTLDVMLLMTAYYFLKTIREPYILEVKNLDVPVLGPTSGAELKSYAGGVQALLLIFLVFRLDVLEDFKRATPARIVLRRVGGILDNRSDGPAIRES